MSDFPKFVEFHEEGPREGFQAEKEIFPLQERVAFIEALSETGLKQIQVGSYVNPKMVPQMADTDDLFNAITKNDQVRYTALWLNQRGFDSALANSHVDVDGKIFLYTSDAFCRKNNGCSAQELNQKQLKWLDAYKENNIALESVYILTAFGCNIQGEVPIESLNGALSFVKAICESRELKTPKIILTDTMGWGNPLEVKRRIDAVRVLLPGARIGMHLHDTRGMGPANVYSSLEMGIDLFESSVAGLGGCPFGSQKNMQAAGNVCTEDMALMCEELGIDTGLNLDALIEAARMVERIIGRPLMGKAMHSGTIASLRK
ncbi:MAG: hydroxymethylglutaryl-CoA lyase [Pseudomonadales bacterium]|nr:hydroxymethylglutaryl-CoA lyase [Pseudomonadales bacterium]